MSGSTRVLLPQFELHCKGTWIVFCFRTNGQVVEAGIKDLWGRQEELGGGGQKERFKKLIINGNSVEILIPLCIFNSWKEEEMLLINVAYFFLQANKRWWNTRFASLSRHFKVQTQTKTQRIIHLLCPKQYSSAPYLTGASKPLWSQCTRAWMPLSTRWRYRTGVALS